VNKSGLYAEFDSKEALFLACLRHYLETRSGGELLMAEPLGWANIERFLAEAPSFEVDQQGCFCVNSMRELDNLPPEARKVILDGRGRYRPEAVADRVHAGVRGGELGRMVGVRLPRPVGGAHPARRRRRPLCPERQCPGERDRRAVAGAARPYCYRMTQEQAWPNLMNKHGRGFEPSHLIC
jgi:AcrR family transcriptional regulator